jgi:hypothetical protein
VNKKILTRIVLILLFLVPVSTGLPQENKVNLNTLTQETQKMSEKADEMTLIWWIPEEFWRVSFEQDPSITADQIEEFIKVLRPYTIIVAVDGKMGTFGGITYESEQTIRSLIQITDNEGATYRPLNRNSINADCENFLAMMKPVFINMLGPMGQNMHFFLFPAENKKGKKIADAGNEGTFSVELGKRIFKWRLPLGSLLLPKICPVCKEELNGAYKFCPWDGTELP